MARDPGPFILPVLTRALDLGQKANKPVVLDFRDLEYLNSSTISPVIRILEQAKRGEARLTVCYRNDLKWQALSFSALYLFQTADGRIAIKSV